MFTVSKITWYYHGTSNDCPGKHDSTIVCPKTCNYKGTISKSQVWPCHIPKVPWYYHSTWYMSENMVLPWYVQKHSIHGMCLNIPLYYNGTCPKKTWYYHDTCLEMWYYHICVQKNSGIHGMSLNKPLYYNGIMLKNMVLPWYMSENVVLSCPKMLVYV